MTQWDKQLNFEIEQGGGFLEARRFGTIYTVFCKDDYFVAKVYNGFSEREILISDYILNCIIACNRYCYEN